jgi:hypothetical protein
MIRVEFRHDGNVVKLCLKPDGPVDVSLLSICQTREFMKKTTSSDGQMVIEFWENRPDTNGVSHDPDNGRAGTEGR